VPAGDAGEARGVRAVEEVLHLEDAAHLDEVPFVGRAAGGPLARLLLRGRLDQPVAADDLLGLGEGAAGDGRRVAAEADPRAVPRRPQTVEGEQHPGLAQLLRLDDAPPTSAADPTRFATQPRRSARILR
jgi:hypothetical protein